MTSTFFGIETALRGLVAHQRAVQVTSHNVANANTPGYSRQQAVMAATAALSVSPGASVGSGVDIATYARVRDQFLDLQYRAQASLLGHHSTASGALDAVEAALAEPGDNGIAAQLSKFWSAWSDLANAPASQAGRQALLGRATLTATAFHDLDAQLASVANQASAQYAALTAPSGPVAQDAAELARLNQAIAAATGAGAQPNDLLDRRDQLLDELAQLAQVSTTTLGDGSIEVRFGDAAAPLVSGTTVNWPQPLNNSGSPPTSSGGKLAALYDTFKPGGTIDSLRSDLSAVAKSLADTVNALHNPDGTGTDFFTYIAGAEASTLTVNVNAGAINASATGAPGANDVARAIADLRGGSTDSLYAALVTRIGSASRDAHRQDATAQSLTDTVDLSRQSTSGVSLDEEMVNLVRYRHAYHASARVMSALDDLLDTLINKTGKVGR